MNYGRRIAAVILVGGFALTLAVAASAEPMVTTAGKKALPPHYTGTVAVLNTPNASFTLEVGNRKYVVTTDSSTKFETYAGRKIPTTFAALKVDDRVSSVGDLEGSTIAAKVVFLLPTKTIHRHADRGTVTALSSSSFTFTPAANKNSSGTVNVTATTVFTKKVNGKIERVSFNAMSLGDRVTFVGSVDSSGVITAKLVHIIPAAPTSPVATSSAH